MGFFDFLYPKQQSNEIVSSQSSSNSNNVAQEENDKNAYISKNTWLKMKGIAKIAFGGLVVLQPHYAFIMAASVCTAWVAHSTIQAFQDPENKGTFFEKLKNSAGKQAGVMVGLMAPYVGIAIATFGGLSYLSKHAEGAQGFFQGGLMATVVGTVALPVVGWAMVGDGLINCIGYETNLLSKGLSLAKNLFKGTEKTVNAAEKNLESPIKTLNTAAVEYSGAARDVANIAQGVHEHGKLMVKGAIDNVQKSDLRVENSPSTIMGAIQIGQNFLTTKSFTAKEEGKRIANPQASKVDPRVTELDSSSKGSFNNNVPSSSASKPTSTIAKILSRNFFGSKSARETSRSETPTSGKGK